MEKIQKFIPDKISIAGHRVAITDKQFNTLVTTINLQTDVINSLIDAITATDSHLDTLQNSVQALANALKTFTED